MARFDNFADLAEHYASLTSADAFAGAFTSEIAASQLSIHDEPTADDLPDADAARAVAAHVTGEIFNLFADTRLALVAPRIAWGIVNSFRLNRQLGNRAAFERNRSIQRLLPVEAVICEGSGIQINLAQNLRAAGVPLTIFKHEHFAIRDQAHA